MLCLQFGQLISVLQIIIHCFAGFIVSGSGFGDRSAFTVKLKCLLRPTGVRRDAASDHKIATLPALKG